MPDNISLDQVVAYIEANRTIYDQTALRQQLLKDNVPAETVALAMARVYGFQVPTPEQPVIQPSPGRRAIVAGAIAIVIFNGVAGFFAVSNGIDGTGFTVFAAVLLAELVVGLVLVATRFRRAGFALLWGILSSFGLVAIAFCLFLGYCLVEYSNL